MYIRTKIAHRLSEMNGQAIPDRYYSCELWKYMIHRITTVLVLMNKQFIRYSRLVACYGLFEILSFS